MTERAKNNPEVMRAVVEAMKTGSSVTHDEMAKRLGVHATLIGRASFILLEQPGLVQDVLDGQLTIYRAFEIARFGYREPCPVCGGRGHVFRKRS